MAQAFGRKLAMRLKMSTLWKHGSGYLGDGTPIVQDCVGHTECLMFVKKVGFGLCDVRGL